MSTITIDTPSGPVALRWPGRIAAHVHGARYFEAANLGDAAAMAELEVLAVAACWPTKLLTPADVGLDPRSVAGDRAFLAGAGPGAHPADVEAARAVVSRYTAEVAAVTRGNYGPAHIDRLLEAMDVTTIAACATGRLLLTVAMEDATAGAVRHRELAEQRLDRKSTRLNSSHSQQSRMPSSA